MLLNSLENQQNWTANHQITDNYYFVILIKFMGNRIFKIQRIRNFPDSKYLYSKFCTCFFESVPNILVLGLVAVIFIV